jgi:hypothetical protein
MRGRQLHRLSALRVAKEVAPGHYADGGGLYMQIADSGARSWVFRFRLGGRMREMGLGPLYRVSLGEARKLAAECRQMVKDQVDPIHMRREQQRQRFLETAADAVVTFREAAEAFIRAREPNWKNHKHIQQWRNTLNTYAYPVIGDVEVRDIDTGMIVRILQPIWTKKAETARRVRGRIKVILDAESVLGHRTGSNPARYVDHLDLVLPRSKKRQAVKHHPALPWEDMPEFTTRFCSNPFARMFAASDGIPDRSWVRALSGERRRREYGTVTTGCSLPRLVPSRGAAVAVTSAAGSAWVAAAVSFACVLFAPES